MVLGDATPVKRFRLFLVSFLVTGADYSTRTRAGTAAGGAAAAGTAPAAAAAGDEFADVGQLLAGGGVVAHGPTQEVHQAAQRLIGHNVLRTYGVRRAQAGRENAHTIPQFGLLPCLLQAGLGD